MRQAGDWIKTYLDYTENTEPPLLYREWVAMSVIAAVLKRKTWLDWGLEDKLYPNMYVVLVGPAGRCRKGTAMAPGIALLKEIGVKLAASALTREALIRELEQSSTTTTTEGGEYLMHASLSIFSKELTVFLRQDDNQLLMYLTDWYDCHDNWEYRTKTQGENEIAGVWVNLMGATTPQLIQKALPLDAIGGGLASRIVFVYEDRKSKKVPAPFVTPEMEIQRKKLSADLSTISNMSGPFKMTKSCIERWTEWYLKMEQTNPNMPPTFEGYLNRRQTHLRKMAMIMSASRSSKKIITVKDFDRALDLLKRTEVKMPRTFSGMGSARDSHVVTILQEYIADNLDVKVKDIYRDLQGYLESQRHFQNLLQLLIHQGFCELSRQNDGAHIKYLPNHGLHGQYGSAWRKKHSN